MANVNKLSGQNAGLVVFNVSVYVQTAWLWNVNGVVLRYRESIVLTDFPPFLLTGSIVHGSLIPTVSDFMWSMNMCLE